MAKKQKEQQSRRSLFENWATDYDNSVEQIAKDEQYPFAGYEAVMNTICHLARIEPGMRVLDLGTGTGELAVRLHDQGCAVCGIDLSPAMLNSARRKLPNATFLEMDLRADWLPEIDGPFDAIVSAYVLHEFDLPEKCRILDRSIQRLRPGGQIIIGDVAFGTRAQHDDVRAKSIGQWDESERYWIASEAIPAAARACITGRWHEVSFCAGVFEFNRSSE